MEDDSPKGGFAVKIVKCPERYPSYQITKAYQWSSSGLLDILPQAVAYENHPAILQEKIARDLKENKPNLDTAMALVDVENYLFKLYCVLSGAVRPEISEEDIEAQAGKWLKDTQMINKQKARMSIKQSRNEHGM